MEIIFVGTGSGKTSIKRNHSSFLIKESDEYLLIDCGDGISKALMQSNINFNSISSLIITHLHADHYAGIASLVTQMKLIKRKDSFKIYIHKNFTGTIESFLNSVYMFRETLGYNLEIIGFEFDNMIYAADQTSFTAKQNLHIIQKTETEHYPKELFVSASLLLKCNGRNIIYTSDIGCADDLYLFKDQRHDILISECAHLSFEELYSAFKNLAPSKLLITHIPDEHENYLSSRINRLIPEDREKIILCYDGLSVIPA